MLIFHLNKKSWNFNFWIIWFFLSTCLQGHLVFLILVAIHVIIETAFRLCALCSSSGVHCLVYMGYILITVTLYLIPVEKNLYIIIINRIPYETPDDDVRVGDRKIVSIMTSTSTKMKRIVWNNRIILKITHMRNEILNALQLDHILIFMRISFITFF